MKTLSENGYFERRYSKIADIGSGTGFLGIGLAVNNPVINDYYSVDISAGLTLLTEYNIERNLSEQLRKGLNSTVITGSGISAIADFGGFDLVLCAPPYLPERENYQVNLNLESPVNGTDLLEEVIKKGKEFAEEVVILVSEIAYPEFEKALLTVNGKARLLGSKLVPIRITPIAPYTPSEHGLNPGSAEWERHLISYKKLKAYTDMLVEKRGLRALNQRNFKYWQEIRIYSVTY